QISTTEVFDRSNAPSRPKNLMYRAAYARHHEKTPSKMQLHRVTVSSFQPKMRRRRHIEYPSLLLRPYHLAGLVPRPEPLRFVAGRVGWPSVHCRPSQWPHVVE